MTETQYEPTPTETREQNRENALKVAKEMDFDPSDMVYCAKCGNTVIRTQKTGNPGFKDKIMCTCEERGLPMGAVVLDDSGNR